MTSCALVRQPEAAEWSPVANPSEKVPSSSSTAWAEGDRTRRVRWASNQVSPANQEAICEAARTMAMAGYRHDDLLMRHVGFYMKVSKNKKKTQTMMAVFCDLSRVTRVSSDEDKEAARMAMLTKLSLEPGDVL
ncbi:hypothetical protein CAOG_06933 [Capsaspora owczarzaki ATCC 30864]|uniref:hypothetical protein n=1 Tax=Capsaspora owczarzaki (strain ATCC 30864) TaxID=595528 RepID=UPI0001FE3C8C|nr:hypothetical protein CAOG_06933 [Capsaspora owczarzaki ATCC 30864]|eukprot:XP_004344554.1 hypothetical protein CAOG_06933 [Capsaspora owczarzaki ATCC 30864]